MQAYTSTVLALPQIKSECPAAEPLYQKAPLWCEKSSEIFSEVGNTPTSRVHQNALFPHQKSKNFLGWGHSLDPPLP